MGKIISITNEKHLAKGIDGEDVFAIVCDYRVLYQKNDGQLINFSIIDMKDLCEEISIDEIEKDYKDSYYEKVTYHIGTEGFNKFVEGENVLNNFGVLEHMISVTSDLIEVKHPLRKELLDNLSKLADNINKIIKYNNE